MYIILIKNSDDTSFSIYEEWQDPAEFKTVDEAKKQIMEWKDDIEGQNACYMIVKSIVNVNNVRRDKDMNWEIIE